MLHNNKVFCCRCLRHNRPSDSPNKFQRKRYVLYDTCNWKKTNQICLHSLMLGLCGIIVNAYSIRSFLIRCWDVKPYYIKKLGYEFLRLDYVLFTLCVCVCVSGCINKMFVTGRIEAVCFKWQSSKSVSGKLNLYWCFISVECIGCMNRLDYDMRQGLVSCTLTIGFSWFKDKKTTLS